MAAIVSGAGRKLPGRCPWAIISGVQPALFLRFQTLMSAPCSAKSCTSLATALVRGAVHGGFAVVVHGVDVGAEFQQQLERLPPLPLQSPPLRRRRRAPRRRPRPTAACSCRRSAAADPRPARATAASAGRPHARAANRNGVEPVVVNRPRPDSPFSSRALMSAPCATSCRTISRLLSFPEPIGRRVAVAANRLADPGDRVQRRVARRPSVRIGAGFQQGRGQLEMAVFDRQDQRGGRLAARGSLDCSGPHRFVHVGPGLKQPMNHVGASLAHGEEQRRKPGRAAECGSRPRL